MKKQFGKKGIFFTLISIMIVSLFLLFYSAQKDLAIKEHGDIAKSRITSTNKFANSIEEVYLERVIKALGQKALNATIKNIISTGVFRENISFDMQQIIMAGTIKDLSETADPTDPNMTLDDMVGFTLIEWLDNLTIITREELNLISEYFVNGIYIKQVTPWIVEITLDINYSINSSKVVAFQRQHVIVSANFTILNYTDPYIAVHTYIEDDNGEQIEEQVFRRIIKVSDPDPIFNSETGELGPGSREKEWFKEFVTNGSYLSEKNSAPSFLMRLENNTNASDCCGIISMAQAGWPTVEGPFEGTEYNAISVQNTQRIQSAVDYQYWSVRCYLSPVDLDVGGFVQASADNEDITDKNYFRFGEMHFITGVSDQPPAPDAVFPADAPFDPNQIYYNFMIDDYHFSQVFTGLSKSNKNIGTCRPLTSP